nr:transmembrane 9 superfamily member 8-like [Ipomoea batatas]
MRVKNQLETQEEAQEETGWKLVHGDVFRAPTNSDLLCVYIGTRVQFLCMTLVTMIFAALGFLSPSNRGGLMTAMLLLWAFMGVFAGFERIHARSRICNRTQDSQIKLIDELWELHLPGNPFKNARIPSPVVPKFTVSSSLTSVLTSDNAIAAATAAGSGTICSWSGDVSHNAGGRYCGGDCLRSGTCLSTKVNCLRPKVDEQPGSLVLDGVDVTGCPIFNDPQVLKAIEFARKAHHGQISKVETKSSLVTVPPFSSLCLIRMHSTAVMWTCFCKSPYKILLVKGTRSPRKMTFL